MRSTMGVESQLSGRGPTDVDVDPVSAVLHVNQKSDYGTAGIKNKNCVN